MDITKVNELCQTKFLPRVKFSDLTENTNYKVTKILKVKSKFSDSGKAVVLELNEALRTFITSRTSETLITNETLYKKLGKKGFERGTISTLYKKGEYEFSVVNVENIQTVQEQ